jgi:hypothetical protein
MSNASDVTVKVDDRVRLLSAVIAATDYPEKAQKRKPHGTHAHARMTRKHVAPYKMHPAVQATQAMLDENTPLEAMFALVMLMEWPDLSIASLPAFTPARYNDMLRDFYEKAELAAFWEQEKSTWSKSTTQVSNVFKDVEFKTFFRPFLGEVTASLLFMPNISYPSAEDIGFQISDQLVCIAPPPLAWGDSPPWPYDEATMVTHSYRSAMMAYGDTLLRNYLRRHAKELEEIVTVELPLTDQFKAQYPSWEEQFSTLFLSAMVAMYLEEHVDESEYKSYMLMEKKARGLTNLPGTVSVLRRYLQEVGGDKYKNLIEFLPIFPKQLRVAQRIVTF